MVQVLVMHKDKSALIECKQTTTIAELKTLIFGQMEGAPPADEQTLVMAGQHCADALQLKHFGACENWIAQVTGFTLNPAEQRLKFIDGELVPLDTPDADFDAYPA